MPNLGDLKALIASDLRRSNLSNEIANAIPDAIRDHEAERFYFNETYPDPYTLTVTPGGGTGHNGPANTPAGDIYPLGPQGQVQEFIKIDLVRALLPGVWYTLKENDWLTIEFFYSTLSNGQPSRWAYRGGPPAYLRIYPLPSQPYDIRIFGHFRAVPLVNDIDSNIWTDQGRNLIRYTVLKRLYTYPIRDAQQVQSAQTAGEAALEYLRRETDQRTRMGRMRAYYG